MELDPQLGNSGGELAELPAQCREDTRSTRQREGGMSGLVQAAGYAVGWRGTAERSLLWMGPILGLAKGTEW